MRCKIGPEIATGRLLHVGNLFAQRIAVGHYALIIVSALRTAVVRGPGLLQIVCADGRGGPDVAVARDFAGVEEVVEHAELQGQLVLVGRDGCTVHRPLGIAVAYGLPVLREVAEDLIVGSIFLDDVDDVLDAIVAAGKGDLFLRRLHAIRSQHVFGPRWQLGCNLLFVDCGQRAVEQCWDVGVGPGVDAGRGFNTAGKKVIGPGSFALVGCEVERAASG